MLTLSIKPRHKALVRCWSCRYLRVIYRGPPKPGRLFAETAWKCTREERFEFIDYPAVIEERVCKDYVRFRIKEIMSIS